MFFLRFKDGGDWNGRRQNDRRANDKSRNPRGSADTQMGAREAEGRGGGQPDGNDMHLSRTRGAPVTKEDQTSPAPSSSMTGCFTNSQAGRGPQVGWVNSEWVGFVPNTSKQNGGSSNLTYEQSDKNSSCIGTLKREDTPASPPMSQI